jgi:hypothetical protein
MLDAIKMIFVITLVFLMLMLPIVFLFFFLYGLWQFSRPVAIIIGVLILLDILNNSSDADLSHHV